MSSVSDVILWQVDNYPFMEVQDLYKLLYEAYMGPGHAVNNIFSVVQWMNDEVMNMAEYNDTSIYEDLDHLTGMVRVNLRPFLKNGGSKEKLLNAFIMTANSFKGNTESLSNVLKVSFEMSDKGLIKYKPEDLQPFFADLEKRGYPAIHHSESYRSHHKPAYRVIQKKFL